jgi:hypothetical protein
MYIRAHVCAMADKVYVFPTSSGKELVQNKSYRLVSAKQGNIITAEGWIVPPRDIPNCQEIDIPDKYRNYITNKDDLGTRGKKAVEIVAYLFKTGKFPILTIPNEVEDDSLQISGTDLIVHVNLKIQVKCDLNGGIGTGTTGNLFLQKAERNIHHIY